MTKIKKKEVEAILRARVDDFNESLQATAQRGLEATRVGGGTLDLSVSIGEMRSDLICLEEKLEAVSELFREQWSTYEFELVRKEERGT